MALVLTGTKLGTKFNIKDKASKENQHDLTYSFVGPDPNCNEEYNDETGRRLIERVHEHSGKEVNSHVFKHSLETDHPTVTVDEFRVLKTGCRQKKFRRKFFEALFMKQKNSVLNKKEGSVPLTLFN